MVFEEKQGGMETQPRGKRSSKSFRRRLLVAHRRHCSSFVSYERFEEVGRGLSFQHGTEAFERQPTVVTAVSIRATKWAAFAPALKPSTYALRTERFCPTWHACRKMHRAVAPALLATKIHPSICWCCADLFTSLHECIVYERRVRTYSSYRTRQVLFGARGYLA